LATQFLFWLLVEEKMSVLTSQCLEESQVCPVKEPLEVAGSKLKETQTPEASLSHLTLGHEVTAGGGGVGWTKLGYMVFLTQSGESLRMWEFLAQIPVE
jgi:hypothetical protein